MTSYWFNDEVSAIGFAAAKGSTPHGDAARGWMVVVDDGKQGIDWGGGRPDPMSQFDRIVSRNGGDGKVEAPAEIVQRQRVVGLSVADMEDGTLTVTMETRFFTVTKEQAQMFKVGSEIEVVLRPAPLA